MLNVIKEKCSFLSIKSSSFKYVKNLWSRSYWKVSEISEISSEVAAMNNNFP